MRPARYDIVLQFTSVLYIVLAFIKIGYSLTSLSHFQKREKPVEVNDQILANIEKAKKAEARGTEYTFEEKNVILYNLGLGAKKTDLQYVL